MAIAGVIYFMSLIVFLLTFGFSSEKPENGTQHRWIITESREFIDLDEEAERC